MCRYCGFRFPVEPELSRPREPRRGVLEMFGLRPSRWAEESGPIVPDPRVTSGAAIASVVLGLLWIGGIGSLVGLLLAYQARDDIRNGYRGGDGWATAGIVLGWIGVLSGVALLLLVLTA